MKSTLTGPLKATAAMIAIISGIMVSNSVSAEQDMPMSTGATVNLVSPFSAL